MAANLNPSSNTASQRGTVELFVSYSHEDQEHKTELVKHLRLLERRELISIWYDQEIVPGEEWNREVNCHLDTAAIILLLISAGFMGSDFCYCQEMKRALQRHRDKKARVIPVIIKPVVWTEDPELRKLQALPTHGKPVVSWNVLDDAYVDIANGIIKVIKALGADQSASIQAPSSETSLIGGDQVEEEPEVEGHNGYVYLIGKIEARFPSPGIEKEFMQATARRVKAAAQSDREAIYSVLADPMNRYLVREMCWVLTTNNLDAYLLNPFDQNDMHLLVESLRTERRADDLDLVIGVRGAPGICGLVAMPTVIFDQIYSMDVDSLLSSIPLPGGMNDAKFRPAAEELLRLLIKTAQNGCGYDEDRALSYLAVRCSDIYTVAAEAGVRGLRLNALEISLPVSSEGRRIVNVLFSYATRNTVESENYLVSVDTTEKYPFLVGALSRWMPDAPVRPE